MNQPHALIFQVIGSAGDGGLDNAAGTASGLRDSAASLLLSANRSAQAAEGTSEQTRKILLDAAEANILAAETRRSVDGAVRAIASASVRHPVGEPPGEKTVSDLQQEHDVLSLSPVIWPPISGNRCLNSCL